MKGAWHSETQTIAPFVVVLNGERVTSSDLMHSTLEVHVWDTPGLDDEVAYEKTQYREDRKVVQKHEQTLVDNLRQTVPRVDVVVYCIRMDDARIRHEDADIISVLDNEFGGWIWSRFIVALTFANTVHPNDRPGKILFQPQNIISVHCMTEYSPNLIVMPDPGATTFRSLSGAVFTAAVQRKTKQVRLMIDGSRRTHPPRSDDGAILVVPIGACGLGGRTGGNRIADKVCGSGASKSEVLWHLGGWDWISDVWRAALSLPMELATTRSLQLPMAPVQPKLWIPACEFTRCAIGGGMVKVERKKAHGTRSADAFASSRAQEAQVRAKDPYDVDVGFGAATNELEASGRGGGDDDDSSARRNPIAAKAAAFGDASLAAEQGSARALAMAAAAAAASNVAAPSGIASTLPGAKCLSPSDTAALHQFVDYPADRVGALHGEVVSLLSSRLAISEPLLRSSTKAKLVPLAVYLSHTPLERFLVTIGRYATFMALRTMSDEDIVNTAIVELREQSKESEGNAEFSDISVTTLQEMRRNTPLQLVRVAEYFTHPTKLPFSSSIARFPAFAWLTKHPRGSVAAEQASFSTRRGVASGAAAAGRGQKPRSSTTTRRSNGGNSRTRAGAWENEDDGTYDIDDLVVPDDERSRGITAAGGEDDEDEYYYDDDEEAPPPLSPKVKEQQKNRRNLRGNRGGGSGGGGRPSSPPPQQRAPISESRAQLNGLNGGGGEGGGRREAARRPQAPVALDEDEYYYDDEEEEAVSPQTTTTTMRKTKNDERTEEEEMSSRTTSRGSSELPAEEEEDKELEAAGRAAAYADDDDDDDDDDEDEVNAEDGDGLTGGNDNW